MWARSPTHASKTCWPWGWRKRPSPVWTWEHCRSMRTCAAAGTTTERRSLKMNSNQATIQKLEKMGMWGMMRALRQSMEAGAKADFTPDELIAHLVDVEWDERQGRRLTRLLQLARFALSSGAGRHRLRPAQ